MKIRTNLTFKLLGTDQVFPEGEYEAIPASNQPNWEKEGKVFIENENGCGLLLEKGDYVVLSDMNSV